jgi:hypothetical protein
VLLAGSLPAPAAPADSTHEEAVREEPAARSERVRITFDVEVPRELLRLVEGKIIDDDSLDAWVLLPGNAELLRAGEALGRLDAEALRENLWHSILGHASHRGTGLGSLAFDPLVDLHRMLGELAEQEEGIRRRIAAHVGAYLPDEVPELEAVVRFHLGGAWSARTSDDIYVNLTRLHEFPPPWFDALASIVAHEAIHVVQRELDDLPRDAFSSVALFGRALERIQMEGVALQVGFGLLDESGASSSYTAYLLRRQRDDLAAFRSALAELDGLRVACVRETDIDACRGRVQAARRAHNGTSAIGHGMARLIETTLGREALVSTLTGGVRRFFDLYREAAERAPDLPVLGEEMLRDMHAAWAAVDERRKVWTLRREAREAHHRGEYGGAATRLREILGIEPPDPVDAYNLACALALGGKGPEALERLEQAVDLGYANLEHMEGDSDLDTLRSAEAYRRLVERLRSPAEPSNSSMK